MREARQQVDNSTNAVALSNTLHRKVCKGL
jgi:hypothetical protein